MAIRMNKKTNKVKKVVKKKSVVKNGKKTAVKVRNFKIPSAKYVEAIGRRKVATARVRIYEGSGDFSHFQKDLKNRWRDFTRKF